MFYGHLAQNDLPLAQVNPCKARIRSAQDPVKSFVEILRGARPNVTEGVLRSAFSHEMLAASPAVRANVAALVEHDVIFFFLG